MTTSGDKFNPYTGLALVPNAIDTTPQSALLGLEPPRFCGDCGRRLVVQVMPNGWHSVCSRHGAVDSASRGQR